MEKPNYDQLNDNTCSGKYIKKHYPEFYELLINKYPECQKFGECLYLYFNNMDKAPVCINCGEKVPFLSFRKGYSKYCCVKCACTDKNYIEQRKQKSRDKYGTDYPTQNPDIKNKAIETVKEKYGVLNVSQCKEVQDKKIQTSIKRYGTKHPMSSQQIKDKQKQTVRNRYGVDNIKQLEEIKEKVSQTNKEKYGGTGFASKELMCKYKDTMLSRYGTTNVNKSEKLKQKIIEGSLQHIKEVHPDILDIYVDDEGRRCYRCRCINLKCNKCKDKQYSIYANVYSNRLSNNIELCTKCNPYNSINNTSIEKFVKVVLDKYNIKYIENDRNILEGKELDIYIPDKKLAIECNGIYYHCDEYIENNYHYNKYKLCKERGIQLLSIWEDWIVNYPTKVESIITSKLGIYNNRIYARQCVLKSISSRDCREFLDKYHLQGNTNTSIRYGLYYKGELVSVMTFGKHRNIYKNKDHQMYELYRYCCKSGIQIIGGAEKILNHFIRDYNPSAIESFSSNDISNGDLYRKLGFIEKTSSISYWYIDHKTSQRYHRFDFTKSKLIKAGYDKNLSEKQIMKQRGFSRIYDSGTTKWGLSFTE